MTFEKQTVDYWLKTIAIDAAMFSLLYAWLVLGIEGAGNVFAVTFWLVVPLRLVASFAVNSVVAASRPRGVASWGVATDIAMAAALAWFGHVWMAGLLLATLALWESALARQKDKAA